MRVMMGSLAFLMGMLMFPAEAEARSKAEQVRAERVAEFDRNNSGGLRRCQMRRFRKAYPSAYANLMAFCNQATVNPQAHGVNFAGQNPNRVRCRRRRVDQPYMQAWIDSAAPTQEHPRAHEAEGRRRGDRGRRRR